MIRRLLALAILLVAARASATTSTCTGAADGTPCADTCIAAGACMTGACVPTTTRPDGTLCSTGNACTSGDHCQSGACVAGAAVVCPNPSSCQIGACDSQRGCFVIDHCTPDMGPLMRADLAGASDLATEPRDLGSPPDLTGVPNDMCIIPVGVEFYQCTTPDGFYIIPFDAGVPHVRGSAIGDCAVSFGATPPPWSFAALLILVGLAARLRLRRTRR